MPLNSVEFTLRPEGNATVVNWAMSGPWPYLHRVFNIVCNSEKMVGGMFDKGLAKLKAMGEMTSLSDYCD